MISSTIRCFVFVLLCITVEGAAQACHGMSQYDRCSTNSACRCLHIVGAAAGTGICVMDQLISSGLAPCLPPNNWCLDQTEICVNHPLHNDLPVCLPKTATDSRFCPPIPVTNTTTAPATTTYTTSTSTNSPLPPSIPQNATWIQNGVTIAGGRGGGNVTNQLHGPFGLQVDEEDTVIVADYWNHRIVEWKRGATSGGVLAGGNGAGNRPDQLNVPTDVLVDQETDSLIICDQGNRRVTRWSRRNGTGSGETILDNIACFGLAMDDEGSLYVTDIGKHEVRRYRKGEPDGTVVAGGNGPGAGLHQLNQPIYVCVDGDHAVYVSDWGNHRVMKWVEGAKEGIVVAGGRGEGTGLTQLSYPREVRIDAADTVYVADSENHRLMRWGRGATQGTVVVGGNGQGVGANQFNGPTGLSFDRQGNLYLADWGNNRVQRFSIEKN